MWGLKTAQNTELEDAIYLWFTQKTKSVETYIWPTDT